MQQFIGNMTGPEIKYRSKQALAGLVQIAGIRDHGPHLASGSEVRLLEAYSSLASQRLHPYLFIPPIITGTVAERAIMSVSEGALKAVVQDVTKSLLSSGLERIVFVTCTKRDLELSRDSSSQLSGKKKFIGIWEIYPAVPEFGTDDPEAVGNAYLTAQMLYLEPDFVKPDMMKYANASFGVVGDPKKATADLGKIIFDQGFETLVLELDKFMRE